MCMMKKTKKIFILDCLYNVQVGRDCPEFTAYILNKAKEWSALEYKLSPIK